MFSIWVNQRKRKEEINLSKSSLRDLKPEREEHLISTQLISEEKRILPRKLIILREADLNG